jgi:dGTPase
LTHSIEVAQIAKSIAHHINVEEAYFRNQAIDEDIVEVAGLAHDLGHPPFGHVGEFGLDACMKKFGGFEGNAQTLRILARLEKKVARDKDDQIGISLTGEDDRFGLDLTYRTLAAVLKYDRTIPIERAANAEIVKGYYASEKQLVKEIKTKVLGANYRKHIGPDGFNTVECSIMDVADDIAYSTYDLEDAFKAGFLTPLDILATDETVRKEIARQIKKKYCKPGSTSYASKVFAQFDHHEVLKVLYQLFKFILGEGQDKASGTNGRDAAVLDAHETSRNLCSNGYVRTQMTSALVDGFVKGVQVVLNKACPALSSVRLQEDVLKQVEVLKRLTFESVIMSRRLRLVEYRGADIVREMFTAVSGKGGDKLLPDDFREHHARIKTPSGKARVICDFIAGMTDQYALEFYGRLKSFSASTIFKDF